MTFFRRNERERERETILLLLLTRKKERKEKEGKEGEKKKYSMYAFFLEGRRRSKTSQSNPGIIKIIS